MNPPHPEVRAVMKEFCDVQRARYGPDWKKILAKQMADASRTYVEQIIKMGAK